MSTDNPLETLYYITLPENFKMSKNTLKIDPSIPLPAQKKDNNSPDSFNMEELTEEQILAGILTVLAYDRHNKNTDYYRSLIMQIRPKIKIQLSEAAILKTKNEDFDLSLRGLDPNDMGIILNYALFLDQRGDSYRRSGLNDDADACDAEAEANYKAAMEAEPPSSDAFFNAAFFYLKQHKFKDAKGCLETFLALTCDTPDEELGANGIYKKERAQEILDNIKNQNIDDERFRAAYDFISRGEEEKGLDKIREFLQNNPLVWNAWFMLGWALRKMNRFEDAKQAFLKSLDCDGGDKNADTFNELSLCYIEEKNFAEAEKCLENALSLDPENTKVMSNLGFLSMKEGKAFEAQRYFETVLEFNPDDKIARSELEKMNQDLDQ